MSSGEAEVTGRWVMRSQWEVARNPSYQWHKCCYCGSAAGITSTEAAHREVTCLLCGTTQCMGNGFRNGCCSICHHGFLPGWAGQPRWCGYAGCMEPAVGVVRRKAVCLNHAGRVKVNRAQTLAEYVAERIAQRDRGDGWEQWIEIFPAVGAVEGS